MYTLGIETSCDETSASVVKNGTQVLSNVVSSSLRFHKKYGGVVPEIAFRKQLETITQVSDGSLVRAGISLRAIDLVSVTDGPGLLGSLLVGISFAKTLSLGLGVPLVGVDHLLSHIYAGFLGSQGERPILPFVALVVSGGHTSLYYVKDFDAIELLGATLDDACGEAFDKVAKILGLGYPGGPVIEQWARNGDPSKITFVCSNTKRALDFSFSGIKTAVLYYVQRHPLDRALHKASGRELTRDIAASFQESVINTLIKKSFLACRLKKTKRLVLGGGVVANNRLREEFSREAQKSNLSIYFPEKEFCTDNAAMVAGLGFRLFKKGKRSGLDLTAH